MTANWINISEIPKTYKSVEDVPGILKQMDAISSCVDSSENGKLTTGEALCVIDFFQDNQLTLQDLQAARVHSGISRFTKMTDKQMTDLVDFLAGRLKGFPKLGGSLESGEPVIDLRNAPTFYQTPDVSSDVPLGPIDFSSYDAERVDLKTLMTDEQIARFEEICREAQESDLPPKEAALQYHEKLLKLQAKIPLFAGEHASIRCSGRE